MGISIQSVKEALLKHQFNTEEVAREFGYDNTNSFRKRVSSATGTTYRDIRDSLRGTSEVPLETEEQKALILRKCEEHGINPDDVAYYWAKDDEVSAFVRRPEAPSWIAIRDQMIEEARNYAPRYKRQAYKPGEHLLVVDPADVHVGKLSVIESTGSSYDIETAVSKCRKAVANLALKSHAFGIEKIIVILGNDILHVDNGENTTTGGTRQDVAGMWYQSFQAAKTMYIGMIEELTLYAPVTLVFCPSNHDNKAGYMLVDSVASWFRNNPNVDCGDANRNLSMAHRKYIMYGLNLLGFSHGDKAKEKDLPALMAHEAAQAWGQARYRYWHLGHLHHRIRNAYTVAGPVKHEKDQIGVSVMKSAIPVDPSMTVYVDYARSPSAPDQWHADNGYVSEAAIESFLYHPTRGQVARLCEYV